MDWIVIVEVAAVSLAVWAAWLSLPRTPVLDWEHLFKTTLSVGMWAEAEATVGPEPVQRVESHWREQVKLCIPFHPAGRNWREKVRSPDPSALPIPALDGERALVEALQSLDTPAERWDRLFGALAHRVDPAVSGALGDPRDLGPAYDPRALLGPEATWEAVSAWAEPVQAGLARRLEHVVVLELGLAEGRSVASALSGVRHHTARDPSDAPEEGWLSLCSAPSDRIVVVLHASLLRAWLHTMSTQPVLVDRVVLVVAVGGSPATVDIERQELIELLNSEALLPELQRRTPIAVVDDVDPKHPLQTGMAPVALDESDPGRLGVRWVDLGPLVVDQVPATALSRALALSIVFLLAG